MSDYMESVAEEDIEIREEAGHLRTQPYCMHDGDDLENVGLASMSGPGRSLWVHVSTGLPACDPGNRHTLYAVPVFPEDS